MKKIETPKIGEILKEEFLSPLGISEESLSSNTNITSSKIQSIQNNECKIDLELSSELGEFLGISKNYFLNLQKDIDIRIEKSQAN